MKFEIDIEDIKSWPLPLYEKIIKNKTLCVSYHTEKSRIPEMCQKDISLRVDPPKNEHEYAYKELATSLEENLTEHSLLAYHCARLTKQEIEDIKLNGLQILTANLINSKLQQSLTNYLTTEDYEYILDKKPINDIVVSNKWGQRAGFIWFNPNRSTLKEEDSVCRFFRSWGGEAIYVGLENDDRICNKLRQMGAPCIIKCAIPFRDAKSFHDNYAERFISKLITDVVEYPDPSPEFDMYVSRNVFPNEISKIIEFHEPEFEGLTGYKNWKIKI